jgi:hypothetical protein
MWRWPYFRESRPSSLSYLKSCKKSWYVWMSTFFIQIAPKCWADIHRGQARLCTERNLWATMGTHYRLKLLLPTIILYSHYKDLTVVRTKGCYIDSIDMPTANCNSPFVSREVLFRFLTDITPTVVMLTIFGHSQTIWNIQPKKCYCQIINIWYEQRRMK